MVLTHKLTEKIEFLRESIKDNEIGEPSKEYNSFKSVRASITNQRGNLVYDDNGNVYTDNISFYLRYISGLTKKDLFILYQGEKYRVLNLTPVQRNQALVIDCVKAF